MTKTRSISAAFVLSAFLAACASPMNDASDAYNVDQRFPIAVEPTMQVFTVPYGGPGAGMDPNVQGQFERFVRSYADGGVGAISVSVSRGYEGAAREFAGRIANQGIERSRIIVGTTDDTSRGSEITISYIRYTAQSTPCGDWSSSLGYTASNLPPANFGCATRANLAAMVADPRDLVAPTGIGPSDAARGLTILDKYRKGEPTPATKTAEQSGAVSSVAAQE